MPPETVPGETVPIGRDAASPPWRFVALAGLTGLLVLGLGGAVLKVGLASYLIAAGNAPAAVRWQAAFGAALSREAEGLMAEDDYAGAATLARRALKSSSFDVRALRVLAFTSAARGDAEQARQVMALASRLSYRDISTQQWLFDDALRVGRFETAYLHADALMRRTPEARSAISWQIVESLDEPKAQRAMAARLAEDPPWRGTFLRIAIRNAALPSSAGLLSALRNTSKPPSDGELSQFFSRLILNNQFDEARRYWLQLTGLPPLNRPPYVFNGAFDQTGGPPPLNWQAIKVSGGDVAWMKDEQEAMGLMRVRHDGFSSSGPMAREIIFAPPGAHIISARTIIDEPAADQRFRLELYCVGGPKIATLNLSGFVGRWARSELAFEIPPEGCPAQWLYLRPNTVDRRETVEMRIDDIAISSER